MFNDGKVDRQGRLWLCTSDTKETDPIGGIYSLTADSRALFMTAASPAATARLQPDGRTFYFRCDGAEGLRP